MYKQGLYGKFENSVTEEQDDEDEITDETKKERQDENEEEIDSDKGNETVCEEDIELMKTMGFTSFGGNTSTELFYSKVLNICIILPKLSIGALLSISIYWCVNYSLIKKTSYFEARSQLV